MKAILTAKVGMFLVVSSVLAIWTLLAAQHVQAHSLTDPSCSRLPTAQNFFTGTETAALDLDPNTSPDESATPKKGTGESGEGNKKYYYAKITVPALTAGELMVSDGTAPSAIYSSEAILCGRQEGSVSSLPSYATAHISADNAATAAETDAMQARDADDAADTTDTIDDERSLKSALRTAANDLGRAANALDAVAAALKKVDPPVAPSVISAAETAADEAEMDEMDADEAADDTANTADEGSLKSDLSDAADALADYTNGALTDSAAYALRVAAHALDPNMSFSINTLISSGDEEYVVVVTVPEGGTPAVSVAFQGVMSTVATAPDGGSFTTNNQRDTHTLRATDPGLLTVETTGSTVDTKGTLNDGTNDIAMDEGSGGNFEIVSPMDDDADYTVYVEGQTRGERGDYGLKVEFGVAEDLVTNNPPAYADTTRENEVLERRRADYFFFNADADRFLTVETQEHAAVTTETNTTGTLFSPDGLVTTDTNSGTGNNFLLRTPIASGKDYIIEVKGSSSSTEGQYVLVTSAENAPSQGSAPDGIMTSTADTVITAAGEVDPHSITVKKAGTLQVKTTGTTDTVGILYGPDGRQIATDDNSADGMKNFLITEYVEAGQYIVTVEGQSRSTTSAPYTLVTNFVEGADIDVGTGTGTGTGTVADLEDQVAQLEDDLDACLMPVETDARGNLGNPPDGGFRSGIGLISGWVCAAAEVEVVITSNDRQGSPPVTLDVAYGTSRPDVPENSNCNNANAGFGMTYNFNHLREGEYTIQALADDEEIGEPRTFEVVHLTTFAVNDEDRFLRGLKDECRVDDFPVVGEKTFLKWEESIQNFVIEDAG